MHITVFSIFLLAYVNGSLFPMYRFQSVRWMPSDFTPSWLLFYGKMVMTSMIMSSLFPYAGPIIKILFRRGCCCCKRKSYKPNTHLNEEFPLERRYAQLLTIFFTCFSYGFSIPLLFIVASFIILIIYILDKLFITYYFKENV
jgi:hypothetical protein